MDLVRQVGPCPDVDLACNFGGMAVDPKEILKRVRLRGEETKQRVTLYLDTELYARFKKACGAATLSHVMEELARDFTEAVEKDQGKKRD